MSKRRKQSSPRRSVPEKHEDDNNSVEDDFVYEGIRRLTRLLKASNKTIRASVATGKCPYKADASTDKPNVVAKYKKPDVVVQYNRQDLVMQYNRQDVVAQYNKPEVVAIVSPKICLAGSARYCNFDLPCEELALDLLGKVLVRPLGDGTVMRGVIVETECYPGGDDKASHSCNGKRTERNTPMFMKPGTTYVYLTYGMYNCFNISSRGDGAAVLLRSIEPTDGMDRMLQNRLDFQRRSNAKKRSSTDPPTASKKALKDWKLNQLCNGPAKLCISFAIDIPTCNKRDLATWPDMWLESGREVAEGSVVMSRRIGIESAGDEWASKLLRFYIAGSGYVSRRDKMREKLLSSWKGRALING